MPKNPVTEQFSSLLEPIKDPQKSFKVNISELLHNYISSFLEGTIPANFNYSALVVQGSSCIYAKKVEYLFTLSTQLYHNLRKKDGDNKKEPTVSKAKEKKNKVVDQFCSIQFKRGRNLSFLKKRVVKTKKEKKKDKAKEKKMKTPVCLMPFEGEIKGETFHDTQGNALGNKSDFILTKSQVLESGWVMTPLMNVNLIPGENSPPDYTFHCNHFSDEEDVNNCDNDVVMASQDTSGIGSQPTPDSQATSGIGSQPTPDSQATSDMCSQDTPDSQAISDSQPMPDSQATSGICSQGTPDSQQTVNGIDSIQSTPCETNGLSQPVSEMEGVEFEGNTDNIPIDDIVNDLDNPAKGEKSVRRSMRQAMKTREEQDDEIIVVKKAIQKKNTFCLPLRMRTKDDPNKEKSHIGYYCARTFFHADNKALKNSSTHVDTLAFKNNSDFIKRLLQRFEESKDKTRKNKIADESDGEEIDVGDFNDADDIPVDPAEENAIQNGPDNLPAPAINGDIPQNDPPIMNGDDLPICPEDPIDNDDDDDDEYEEDDILKKLQLHDRNAEITARVKEFEDKLNPFLEEVGKRGNFDIDEYGSKIIESFDCANENKVRRQTISFRDICRGMEQWQIHRYFMALLPLANIGNVSIEAEERNGEEEIMITLLSRKMHHLALEEFGNEPSTSK